MRGWQGVKHTVFEISSSRLSAAFSAVSFSAWSSSFSARLAVYRSSPLIASFSWIVALVACTPGSDRRRVGPKNEEGPRDARAKD